MKRLMELLSTPLGAWATLQYEQYAEWVSVRARVALLQAHAQCACIDGSKELTTAIVAKAQRPHRCVGLADETFGTRAYLLLAGGGRGRELTMMM